MELPPFDFEEEDDDNEAVSEWDGVYEADESLLEGEWTGVGEDMVVDEDRVREMEEDDQPEGPRVFF